MKTTILSFLLSVVCLTAYAQKTKKVKNKLKDGTNQTEVFYVLKSDKTTKHGPYTLWKYNGDLIEKGNYIQGKKDGHWVNYTYGMFFQKSVETSHFWYTLGTLDSILNHNDVGDLKKTIYIQGEIKTEITYLEDNTMLRLDFTEDLMHEANLNSKTGDTIRTGYWKNHKKVGRWYYKYNNSISMTQHFKDGKMHGLFKSFYADGKPLASANYKNGNVVGPKYVFNKNGDTSFYKKMNIHTPDKLNDAVEYFELHDTNTMAPAQFGNSEKAIHNFIISNIQYPSEALNIDLSAIVLAQFVVDKTGGLINVSTLDEKIGFGTEEEALRVINLTSGQWMPALHNGHLVKMNFRIPIRFMTY